jgi:glutamate 5-kinase
VYKSVTIKIGSNVLTRSDNHLDVARMGHITEQIAQLHRQGLKVILVSSGAVASGRSLVASPPQKDPVAERQLLSSVGQVKLLTTYSGLFESRGMTCAQILVTKQDFSTREHYLNIKHCLTVLLENNIIPIINENDAVSVTALMFTDNDELAGLVATMMNTEALFILSNVDGIYNGDPKKPESKLIECMEPGKVDLEAYVTAQKSNFGRGGMLTKGRIAKNTAASGIAVHIANGTRDNIILNLTNHPEQVPHTLFKPDMPSPAVKKWMAYSAGFAHAEVHINEGAREALFSKKANSLLLAGVTKMPQEFQKGDLLRIIDANQKLIGIGKAQYERKKALEHMADKKYRPLVHYDYLFLYP